MNKFDVVEKIPIKRLLLAFLIKTRSPFQSLNIGLKKKEWHSTTFNWGRNALYALFKRLPYKTIHLPAFTCPILTDAALAAGKKVKLLEVDLNTFNLGFKKLPKKAPECLVVVHTFGNPVNIKRIRKKYPQTFIIEDCAHALFSQLNKKFVGQEGNVILFSLYKQVANLNGALLLTKENLNIKQKQESLKAFWPRIIFKAKGYHHILINLLRHRYIDTLEKRRFTDNFSANFLSQRLFVFGLFKLRKEIKERKEVLKWFYEKSQENQYFIPQIPALKNKLPAYQFVIRLKPKFIKLRDKVVWNLRKQNIFLDRLWYCAPITEKRFSAFTKNCPNAFQLANSVISLPISPKFKEKDIIFLIDKITEEIEKQLSSPTRCSHIHRVGVIE